MKAAALLVLALPALATAAPDAPSAGPARADFERLKALAGTWTGPASHGGQSAGVVTVVYKVTGGGNVVEETQFPGTPHEMVTMYHMDGAQLALTHYCAGGNEPHMVREEAKEPNTLSFRFAGGANMKDTDQHMHAARFTFVDADHVKATWTSFDDGKPAGEAVFDLTRSK